MQIYYLLLLFTAVPGAWLCRRERGRLCTVSCLAAAGLVLTAVASFRYAIGFDYYSYRSIYYETAHMSVSALIRAHTREFLFYLTNKAFVFCGFSYTAFLAATGLFIHGVAMWFIFRYSKIPWLSVYLYVALQFLAHNMNLIRQSLALTFFLLAFPYLVNRKFLPFAALMIAGGLFHNSLLPIILFYFLLPVKSTWKNMLLVSAAAAALYLFSPGIWEIAGLLLPEKYASYIDSFYWQGNSFRYALLPAAYFLITLPFRKRLLRSDPLRLRAIYLNSALYTALINLFITRHFILERFSVYLFIFSILLIPEIVELYSPPFPAERQPAAAGKGFLVLSLFLMFGFSYFSFAAAEGYHNVYPYVSLLDRAVSSGTVSNPGARLP